MDVTLRYFVEVAEQRSINKAAEVLYVTQPSLSRAIHSLENEAGQALFVRATTAWCSPPSARTSITMPRASSASSTPSRRFASSRTRPPDSKLSVACAWCFRMT